jgi:predicted CXXCH cytochrome family protein
MDPLKHIKIFVIIGCLAFAVGLVAVSSLSVRTEASDKRAAAATAVNSTPTDFVGSETCKACHEDQFNSFAKTKHATLQHAGWKAEKQGCESCHGAGKAHVEGGGDKTKIRTFAGETPKQKSEACLTCHSGKEEHNNFRRGEHWRNDVACVDCHSPHATSKDAERLVGPTVGRRDAASALVPLSPFAERSNRVEPLKMLVRNEPQLCLTCHNEMKAQFTQPFHHRVLEGTMKCSDCHNPHGGFEQKQARLAVGVDAACIKCHADKQGPFVYEHAPAKVEGCTMCHTPHGSSNPKMLTRSNVPQLCLECHSNLQTAGAPNTPSFHNVTTARFQNCTTCHAKIHGSNTNKTFFR